MKRMMILMMVVLLSGCSNELELANARIAELETEVSELMSSRNQVEEELTLKIGEYTVLEKEHEDLLEYHDIATLEVRTYESIVDGMPYYIRDIFIETYESGVQAYMIGVPKPLNSYLLIDGPKVLGGYNVFEAEEGPCEAAAFWKVYEDEEFIYEYVTNVGCNPSWIDATPIYLKVDKSLISVEMAINLGYITVTDLEESGYFFKSSKE